MNVNGLNTLKDFCLWKRSSFFSDRYLQSILLNNFTHPRILTQLFDNMLLLILDLLNLSRYPHAHYRSLLIIEAFHLKLMFNLMIDYCSLHFSSFWCSSKLLFLCLIFNINTTNILKILSEIPFLLLYYLITCILYHSVKLFSSELSIWIF